MSTFAPLALVGAYRADAAPLWLNALGFVAGTLGTMVQVPQAWRLWVSRKWAGLSPASCVMGWLTPVAWTAYGIAEGSPPQAVMNGVATVAATFVLAGLVRLGRPRLSQWLPLTVAGTLAILIAFAVDRAVVGGMASAMTIAMAVPQIVVLARQRRAGRLDAAGVSRLRWLMSALCNVGWMAYGLLVADVPIGGTSTVLVTLSTTVLALTYDRSGRFAGAQDVPMLASAGSLPRGD